MRNDLVSVIIPVYNGEIYIRKCLESIVNQSYENLEIIVLNDGSTDKTKEIVDEFKRNDSRIISIYRKNKGLIITLNELVNLSSGKYIVRMDADDVAYRHRIKLQIEFMNQNNLDVCGSYVRWIGDITTGAKKKPVKNNSLHKTLIFDTPFWHPTIVFHSRIKHLIKYDIRYKWVEDTKLWADLINQNCRLGNYPDVLLDYRIHSNQVSNKHNLIQLKNLEKVKLNFLRTNELYQGLPLSSKKWLSQIYSDNCVIDLKQINICLCYLRTNDLLPEKDVLFRFLIKISREMKLLNFILFKKILNSNKIELNLIQISQLILITMFTGPKDSKAAKFLKIIFHKYIFQ